MQYTRLRNCGEKLFEQFFSIISIELKGSITRCRYYTREGMPERKL